MLSEKSKQCSICSGSKLLGLKQCGKTNISSGERLERKNYEKTFGGGRQWQWWCPISKVFNGSPPRILGKEWMQKRQREGRGEMGSFLYNGHTLKTNMSNTYIYIKQIVNFCWKKQLKKFAPLWYIAVKNHLARQSLVCTIEDMPEINTWTTNILNLSFVFLLWGQAQSQRQHLPVCDASYLPRKSANSKWWGAYPSLAIVYMCSTYKHISRVRNPDISHFIKEVNVSDLEGMARHSWWMGGS